MTDRPDRRPVSPPVSPSERGGSTNHRSQLPVPGADRAARGEAPLRQQMAERSRVIGGNALAGAHPSGPFRSDDTPHSERRSPLGQGERTAPEREKNHELSGAILRDAKGLTGFLANGYIPRISEGVVQATINPRQMAYLSSRNESPTFRKWYDKEVNTRFLRPNEYDNVTRPVNDLGDLRLTRQPRNDAQNAVIDAYERTKKIQAEQGVNESIAISKFKGGWGERFVTYTSLHPNQPKTTNHVTMLLSKKVAKEFARAIQEDPDYARTVVKKAVGELGYPQEWIQRAGIVPLDNQPRPIALFKDKKSTPLILERSADDKSAKNPKTPESSKPGRVKRFKNALSKARKTGINVFGAMKTGITREATDDAVLRLKEMIHGKEDASKTEKAIRMLGAIGVSALLGVGVTVAGGGLLAGGATAGVLVGSKSYLRSNAKIIKTSRDNERYIGKPKTDKERKELKKEVRTKRARALGMSAAFAAGVVFLPFAGDIVDAAVDVGTDIAKPWVDVAHSIGDSADAASEVSEPSSEIAAPTTSDAPAPSPESTAPAAPAETTTSQASPETTVPSQPTAETTAPPASPETTPPPSPEPSPAASGEPTPQPSPAPGDAGIPAPEVPTPPTDMPSSWTGVLEGESFWSQLADANFTDEQIAELLQNNPNLTQELIDTGAFTEQLDGTPGLSIDATPEQMQKAWEIINNYR